MWLDLSGDAYDVQYQAPDNEAFGRVTRSFQVNVTLRCLLCVETGASIRYCATAKGWVLSVYYADKSYQSLFAYGTENEAVAGLEQLSRTLGAETFPYRGA